uniref:Uncharacterized protein n=1 Tax=Opuntia streptacantha TaxID=393608 RepID=A0A7C9E4L3_OPUST
MHRPLKDHGQRISLLDDSSRPLISAPEATGSPSGSDYHTFSSSSEIEPAIANFSSVVFPRSADLPSSSLADWSYGPEFLPLKASLSSESPTDRWRMRGFSGDSNILCRKLGSGEAPQWWRCLPPGRSGGGL